MSEDARSAPVREGYWFRPKTFGLGATPVAWQGWAVTIGLVVVLGAMLRRMPTPQQKALAGVVLTGALAITIAKTDGGLRWRWDAGS